MRASLICAAFAGCLAIGATATVRAGDGGTVIAPTLNKEVGVAPAIEMDIADWTRGADGSLIALPVPAVSAKLFDPIDEAKDAACPKADEVLQHYIAADSALKDGNVKLLAGGMEQSFADAWRHGLHMKTVKVTAVVAQPLDLSSVGGSEAFDVVEFGADGCAFSRTIMPAEIFLDIIKAALGVSI